MVTVTTGQRPISLDAKLACFEPIKGPPDAGFPATEGAVQPHSPFPPPFGPVPLTPPHLGAHYYQPDKTLQYDLPITIGEVLGIYIGREGGSWAQVFKNSIKLYLLSM